MWLASMPWNSPCAPILSRLSTMKAAKEAMALLGCRKM